MKTPVNQNLSRKCLLPLLMLLLSLALPSCELFNKDDPKPEPHPEVPAELARKWMAGRFSMGEFWEYDGTYTGNAFETGIAFNFKPDGKCEFYLVAGGTSYGCRTEAFVYKKGTVKFKEGTSFTFYPTEGRARGFYKGCGSSYQNYDLETEKKDLKPETYYYTFQKNSSGQDQLFIRLKPDATAGTTFYPVNW